MKYAAPIMLLALCCACAKNQPVPAPEAVAWSAQSTPGEPLVKAGGVAVEVAARVKSVNLETRELTLVAADGAESTVKVSPAVQRLSEIKRGDLIELEYTESIAFEVRKPTADEIKNPAAIEAVAAKAGPDQPPAAGTADVLRAVLKVVGVNRKAGTVTVKGPLGRVYTVRPQDPRTVHQVKVGETVVMTYTEAVAITVKPAKS